MPASASVRFRSLLAATAALLVLPLLAPGSDVRAAAIKVREAGSNLVAGQLTASARLDFDLSEEALKALDNGVALNIVVELEVLQERFWLWDRTLIEHSENFRLERQALSKNYLVTHKYRRRSFLSLEEALQFIGTMSDYPLLDSSELEAGKHYRGRIRAWLDIESLPAPMRPAAHISASWRLDSGWYEWPIRP